MPEFVLLPSKEAVDLLQARDQAPALRQQRLLLLTSANVGSILMHEKKRFLEMKADILYIFMSEGTFTDHFDGPSFKTVHRALDLPKPLFSSNLDFRVFIWSMACCFSSISSTKVSSMPPNSSLQSLSLLHAIKYQAEV